MLFKNIMVPYDTSENALNALKTAVEMIKCEEDARVHVVSIVNAATAPSVIGADSGKEYAGVPTFLMDNDDYKQAVEYALEQDKARVMEAIRDTIAPVEDRAVVTVEFGLSITADLVAYATDHDCDLIVMGRRGLGALRSMLGSVSFGVLQNADIPVMVVK